MKARPMRMMLVLFVVAASCGVGPQEAAAQPQNPMDRSLKELGYIPLPDLGLGTYTRDGHTEPGGLYPDGWATRSADFEATVLEIAKEQIRPLDAQGNPDPARNLKVHFPNVKLAYYSSRERAYLMYRKGEPDCHAAGFAVRWMIDKQMKGDPGLNWDPARGPVTAPLILWGPYFWCDGLKPRSDGLIWTCCEPTSDVYNNSHPEASGAQKCADQIYAFFKTDPTATPWYLRKTVTGQAPQVTAQANIAEGDAPLTVHFSAQATDPDGKVVEYVWTFGDGTFSYNPRSGPGKEPFYLNPKPVKIFPNPGFYTAYLTVTDNDGNAVTREIRIKVTGDAPSPKTIGPSRLRAPRRSRS
ncbi:MAG: PKD domain-containing protein [Planctomycetes bacterium]|nr:PKD domain-containing protein [Planctomycetota bacterium]